MTWRIYSDIKDDLSSKMLTVAMKTKELFSGFEIAAYFSLDEPTPQQTEERRKKKYIMMLKGGLRMENRMIKMLRILIGKNYVVKKYGVNYIIGYIGDINSWNEFIK